MKIRRWEVPAIREIIEKWKRRWREMDVFWYVQIGMNPSFRVMAEAPAHEEGVDYYVDTIAAVVQAKSDFNLSKNKARK